MVHEVSDNPAHHRFELEVEGHLAETYYKIEDGVITFIHTEVPPELGGKGVGSRLIKGALDQVRARGIEGDRRVPVRQSLYREAPGICGSPEGLARRDKPRCASST